MKRELFYRVVGGQVVTVPRDPRLPDSDETLQEVAEALWATIWPARPWPKYRVRWVWRCKPVERFSEVSGVCIPRRRLIEMSYCGMRHPTPGYAPHGVENVLETLVHELVHARLPTDGHSARFERALRGAMRKAWRAAGA